MNETERQTAIENFGAAVKREMARNNSSRLEATQTAVKKNPQLHAAFLRATHKAYRKPADK